MTEDFVIGDNGPKSTFVLFCMACLRGEFHFGDIGVNACDCCCEDEDDAAPMFSEVRQAFDVDDVGDSMSTVALAVDDRNTFS